MYNLVCFQLDKCFSFLEARECETKSKQKMSSPILEKK